MADFISARKSNILAYFAVHAYSQYWLIPYGSGDAPTDYDELLRVAQTGANALMAVYNKKWDVGQIQDVIYPAAGGLAFNLLIFFTIYLHFQSGSIDWIKDSAQVKYSYAFELRPSSSALNGFIVKESEIKPSATEVWAGLVASIDSMIQ